MFSVIYFSRTGFVFSVTIPTQPIVQFINATSKGITIFFIQPLPGTTISVEGQSTAGHRVSAGNLTGIIVTFSDITLGVRYNFTLTTINSFGDESPVTRVNATSECNN